MERGIDMSRFLAPTHTWLFNRILITENIEKAIEAEFQDETVVAYHNGLKETIGDYMKDEPLETLEESNIHGWLQKCIIRAETRQAGLISQVIKNKGAEDIISKIYFEAGAKLAKSLDVKIEGTMAIFKGLSEVLLKGRMSCDRVNHVVEQTDEQLTWKIVQCAHRNNWEKGGMDVAYYYKFRAALIEGFVNTVSNQFTYTYSNNPEHLHRIIRKQPE